MTEASPPAFVSPNHKQSPPAEAGGLRLYRVTQQKVNELAQSLYMVIQDNPGMFMKELKEIGVDVEAWNSEEERGADTQ